MPGPEQRPDELYRIKMTWEELKEAIKPPQKMANDPERIRVEIKPSLKSGWGQPVWYHHHGRKMMLQENESDRDKVVIKGSAAELNITHLEELDYRGRERWNVEWMVGQSPEEKVQGSRVFSERELLSAFGFENTTDPCSVWMIQRYGGSTASQGKFIRFDNYLNIPHPGTGHDGDPNVSIELDDEIKEAVKKLL